MDAEKSDNSSFEDLSNFKDMPEIEDIEKPEPAVKAETGETSETNTTTNSNEATGNEPDKEKDEDTIDVLGNGQLVKRVISKSKLDKRPIRGDLVTIKYTGKLDDGTVVEQADNAKLHVGDFEVVQGLDMTVPLMNVGEVAEVKINSRFAYGALGLKKDDNPLTSIPPNATLTYDVELLDAKSEDFSDLKAFEIRRRYGTQKKERANFWYNRGEYNTAIQLYRRALEYLDDRDGDPDSEFDKEDLGYSNSDLQQLLDDRLIVYNNLAMAQIKILAYDAALKSVEHVLLCQPNNAKALYRKGRILDAKCDTKGAIALLQKAATLEPENRIIQQDLAKLMIKQRREENNEKEMYQKMLGQAKKLEQKNKQPKQQTNVDNSKQLKLFCYILGSVLIGVAGAAIYRYKY